MEKHECKAAVNQPRQELATSKFVHITFSLVYVIVPVQDRILANNGVLWFFRTFPLLHQVYKVAKDCKAMNMIYPSNYSKVHLSKDQNKGKNMGPCGY